MHDLRSLKRHLILNGIEIKSFDGAFLITKKGDHWAMLDDQFYKNDVRVDRKQIKKDYPKSAA